MMTSGVMVVALDGHTKAKNTYEVTVVAYRIADVEARNEDEAQEIAVNESSHASDWMDVDVKSCDLIKAGKTEAEQRVGGKKGSFYHCFECCGGRCFFRGRDLECPEGHGSPVFREYRPPFRLDKSSGAV